MLRQRKLRDRLVAMAAPPLVVAVIGAVLLATGIGQDDGRLSLILAAAVVAAAVWTGLVGWGILRSLSTLAIGVGGVVEAQRRVATGDLHIEELPTLGGNGPDDQISRLAASIDTIGRTAIDVAESQRESIREGLSTIVVNLARRNQSLLDRQVEYLDSLEQTEEDPERLGELFRVDHLATRMRRNAESLLVLAGADPGKRKGKPVALSDVIRVAIGEVENYQQIELGQIDDGEVPASVAVDLAHLTAELMENATQFSPPSSPVEVSSLTDAVVGQYRIRIADRGMGLGERLDQANATLADPPELGLGMGRSLGFMVIGRLAQRLRTTVRLSANDGGGTVAEIAIPLEHLRGRPEPPTPPAATSTGTTTGTSNATTTGATTQPATAEPAPSTQPVASTTLEKLLGISTGDAPADAEPAPESAIASTPPAFDAEPSASILEPPTFDGGPLGDPIGDDTAVADLSMGEASPLAEFGLSEPFGTTDPGLDATPTPVDPMPMASPGPLDPARTDDLQSPSLPDVLHHSGHPADLPGETGHDPLVGSDQPFGDLGSGDESRPGAARPERAANDHRPPVVRPVAPVDPTPQPTEPAAARPEHGVVLPPPTADTTPLPALHDDWGNDSTLPPLGTETLRDEIIPAAPMPTDPYEPVPPAATTVDWHEASPFETDPAPLPASEGQPGGYQAPPAPGVDSSGHPFEPVPAPESMPTADLPPVEPIPAAPPMPTADLPPVQPIPAAAPMPTADAHPADLPAAPDPASPPLPPIGVTPTNPPLDPPDSAAAWTDLATPTEPLAERPPTTIDEPAWTPPPVTPVPPPASGAPSEVPPVGTEDQSFATVSAEWPPPTAVPSPPARFEEAVPSGPAFETGVASLLDPSTSQPAPEADLVEDWPPATVPAPTPPVPAQPSSSPPAPPRLQKRQRGASNVPIGEGRPVAAPTRSPEEVRAMLSRYRDGLRHGGRRPGGPTPHPDQDQTPRTDQQ